MYCIVQLFEISPSSELFYKYSTCIVKFFFKSLEKLRERTKKGHKSLKKRNCIFFFGPDFTKNAKLEDTKRGKGSNFLSFLAPGGDGTWFRILEKKVVDASCYITLCQIMKFCTIFPFLEWGKSSGSAWWINEIKLIP